MSTTANSVPADQDAARRALLEKAHEFYRQFPDAHNRGDVAWLSDDDQDALLIFTRGEYRQQLLEAVCAIEAPSPRFELPPGKIEYVDAHLRKACAELLLAGALICAQLDHASTRAAYDTRPDTKRLLQALEQAREALS